MNMLESVREWINTSTGRVITITACIVVILGGLIMTVMYASKSGTQRKADEIRGKGLDYLYYCQACKQTGTLEKQPYDLKFPVKCPHCGEKKAVLAFKCVKCREIIERKPDPVFRCPHCNYVYDSRIPSE